MQQFIFVTVVKLYACCAFVGLTFGAVTADASTSKGPLLVSGAVTIRDSH